MFCPNCGVKLNKPVNFCEICGAHLKDLEKYKIDMTKPPKNNFANLAIFARSLRSRSKAVDDFIATQKQELKEIKQNSLKPNLKNMDYVPESESIKPVGKVDSSKPVANKNLFSNDIEIPIPEKKPIQNQTQNDSFEFKLFDEPVNSKPVQPKPQQQENKLFNFDNNKPSQNPSKPVANLFDFDDNQQSKPINNQPIQNNNVLGENKQNSNSPEKSNGLKLNDNDFDIPKLSEDTVEKLSKANELNNTNNENLKEINRKKPKKEKKKRNGCGIFSIILSTLCVLLFTVWIIANKVYVSADWIKNIFGFINENSNYFIWGMFGLGVLSFLFFFIQLFAGTKKASFVTFVFFVLFVEGSLAGLYLTKELIEPFWALIDFVKNLFKK